jgi:ferrous iron transport protein B
MLVPLMSCSARLPVYVVFGLAFFGHDSGKLIWAMYALGILIAMLVGAFFSRMVFKRDKDAAFVLELPPYRRPALRGLFIHTGERISGFVRKAGTIILLVTVVLWFLLNLPWGVENQRESLFGRVSATIAPVFGPLGFGNWESTGSLVSGFVAKEIVVSTMNQIYVGAEEADAEGPTSFAEDLAEIVRGFGDAALDAGKSLLSVVPGVNLQHQKDAEDTALSTALRTSFSLPAAVAFVTFVLLYVPCAATLGAIRHEYGSKWAVFSAAYQLALAWVVALLIYQGGQLVGVG